jgi:hypothetical protein
MAGANPGGIAEVNCNAPLDLWFTNVESVMIVRKT